MELKEKRSPGQVAYEAYYAYSGGKSLISYHDLPTWDNQAPAIRAAWEAAAKAVLWEASRTEVEEKAKESN